SACFLSASSFPSACFVLCLSSPIRALHHLSTVVKATLGQSGSKRCPTVGHHAAGPIPRSSGHRSWRTRHNGAVPYTTRTTVSRNYAGLSRERIIIEALHIIAGRGLGGLSMRRLGDALEVEAMAIYHHFPLGKEQLFNAIAAYVTSPAPTGAAFDDEDEEASDSTEEETERVEEELDTRPWDVRLTMWAEAYRERLLAYSGALSLLAHRAPHTPQQCGHARADAPRLHRSRAEGRRRGARIGCPALLLSGLGRAPGTALRRRERPRRGGEHHTVHLRAACFAARAGLNRPHRGQRVRPWGSRSTTPVYSRVVPKDM